MKWCFEFKKYRLLLLGGLLVGGLGVDGIASALTYQTSQSVEFTFNPTISVSLSSNGLIIDNLTPNSSSDSNIITVSVATNSGYGYYMSATAGTSTGDTNLTSTTNSGNVFTNLSSNAATLAAFPDDRWGYSYSTDDGSTWISGSQGDTASGYNGLPLDNDDSGATGVILASTDSFSNSGSVKFKIGAKASATQATGTYTNTVNFYAVANPEPQLGPESCEAGKICYHVNSLTQTEGTMGKQSVSDGNTVTLLASNFSRTGYGFAGWSDAYDYTGNLYGPQETITVPTGTTANGLSLYAVWIKSQGSIQDQSKVASVCNSLTTAPTDGTANLTSVSALTDQRDNNTYAIARLADGKCWMIENLRLESTAEHNSDGTLAQGYGTSATYGNFSGLANAESKGFRDKYSANSLYSNDGSNNTINIGTTDYPEYRIPRYNNLNTQSRAQNDPNSNSFPNDNTTGGMYSYGNYYTWSAAIANTIYYEYSDSTDADGKTSETVNTSICPTGWRLPSGGYDDFDEEPTGGEFYNLNYKINNDSDLHDSTASKRIRAFPNNFLYSGLFGYSAAYSRGDFAYYWSSTTGDWNDNTAYGLYFAENATLPGTENSKEVGRSIRCTVGT